MMMKPSGSSVMALTLAFCLLLISPCMSKTTGEFLRVESMYGNSMAPTGMVNCPCLGSSLQTLATEEHTMMETWISTTITVAGKLPYLFECRYEEGHTGPPRSWDAVARSLEAKWWDEVARTLLVSRVGRACRGLCESYGESRGESYVTNMGRKPTVSVDRSSVVPLVTPAKPDFKTFSKRDVDCPMAPTEERTDPTTEPTTSSANDLETTKPEDDTQSKACLELLSKPPNKPKEGGCAMSVILSPPKKCMAKCLCSGRELEGVESLAVPVREESKRDNVVLGPECLGEMSSAQKLQEFELRAAARAGPIPGTICDDDIAQMSAFRKICKSKCDGQVKVDITPEAPVTTVQRRDSDNGCEPMCSGGCLRSSIFSDGCAPYPKEYCPADTHLTTMRWNHMIITHYGCMCESKSDLAGIHVFEHNFVQDTSDSLFEFGPLITCDPEDETARYVRNYPGFEDSKDDFFRRGDELCKNHITTNEAKTKVLCQNSVFARRSIDYGQSHPHGKITTVESCGEFRCSATRFCQVQGEEDPKSKFPILPSDEEVRQAKGKHPNSNTLTVDRSTHSRSATLIAPMVVGICVASAFVVFAALFARLNYGKRQTRAGGTLAQPLLDV